MKINDMSLLVDDVALKIEKVLDNSEPFVSRLRVDLEKRRLGDIYDSVMGWQTESEVRDWAVFVANL